MAFFIRFPLRYECEFGIIGAMNLLEVQGGFWSRRDFLRNAVMFAGAGVTAPLWAAMKYDKNGAEHAAARTQPLSK